MKTTVQRKNRRARGKSFGRATRGKAASDRQSGGNGADSLRLKRLLVPVDFSKCSEKALDYAISLARQFGSQIELLHVLEPNKVFNDPKSPYAKWDEWAMASARNRLTEMAGEKIEELIPVNAAVEMGRAYDEICETARREHSDLIVIGTHGRTGLKRLFLGSTAERVVRHASCSVLVVRGAGISTTRGFPTGKILVPVDFSNCSRQAIQYAMNLARQFQAQLQLVHVVPTYYPSGDYDYYDYAMLEAELKESTERQLVAMAKRIHSKGIAVETMILHGRPSTEITEAARGLGAGLIVISTHGRTGIQHVLLGSTTEEVVRHAHCPVLTLRERKHGTKL